MSNKLKVTYHKPCNINNFNDIEWVLNSTENLEYIEMDGFDKCCGLNGLSKIKDYKIMLNIFKSKINNIQKSKANIVTTSCLGCELALKSYLQVSRLSTCLSHMLKGVKSVCLVVPV